MGSTTERYFPIKSKRNSSKMSSNERSKKKKKEKEEEKTDDKKNLGTICSSPKCINEVIPGRKSDVQVVRCDKCGGKKYPKYYCDGCIVDDRKECTSCLTVYCLDCSEDIIYDGCWTRECYAETFCKNCGTQCTNCDRWYCNRHRYEDPIALAESSGCYEDFGDWDDYGGDDDDDEEPDV